MPSPLPTQLAERSAATGFALHTPPVGNDLVVVQSPEAKQQAAVTLSPEHVAALARRSDSVVRSLEVTGGRIAGQRVGVFSGLVMAGSAVTAFFSFFMGGVMASLSHGRPPGLDDVPLQLVLTGAAATGVLIGTNLALRGLANSALKTSLGSELETLERAAAHTTGLERAWIARRAMDAASAIGGVTVNYADPDNVRMVSNGIADSLAKSIFPRLDSTKFTKRLLAVAAKWSEATPEERAQIELVHAIYAQVFVLRTTYANSTDPDTRIAWHNDSTHGAAINENIEKIICQLEQLTPEGRALVSPGVIDAVVFELTKDPGNRYRLQRFLEATTGTSKPYSTEFPETVGDRTVELDALRKARGTDRDPTFNDADEAIRELAQQLTEHSEAQAKLASSTLAEQVAAFFESKHLRAALYEAEGKTFVTVYDPLVPPRGGYVEGRYGREGPSPKMNLYGYSSTTGPR